MGFWSGGWGEIVRYPCARKSFNKSRVVLRADTFHNTRLTRKFFMTNEGIRPRREDFSSLEKHHRQGKVLTPPLMRISGLATQSWHAERLPDMLWAALL